jgi:predicted amidohydrolase YtcJ
MRSRRRPAAVPSFLLRGARLVPVRGRGVSDFAATHQPPVGVPMDVLVIDGRVVEVGEQLGLPRGVAEHHADGRWLVPGLWDQHVHLGQWTMVSQRLDLTGTHSVEQVLGRVTRRLAETPDGPVIGWGHRSASWTRQPTVAELDQVTGDRPVVLISGDGHNAWINTVGLRGLRLPARDDVVAEAEWFQAYPRLSDVAGSDGTSPEAYLHTLREAAAKGVTGLVDLEFDQSLSAWPEREAAGAELLRVKVGAYIDTVAEFLGAGLRTGDMLPGCGPLVTMGPLKIISDGSLNTRTAWCCAPYADGGGTGAPNLSGESLRSLLGHADRHGLEVAVHAIGDAAVREALAAYAETGATGTIEHAQLMTREDSRTMARLGIRASVQPAHLLDDRDLTESFWPDRTDRCFALRWLHDDAVEVVFGSDAPVSPLDPWDAMAAAVHRSGDDREAWHPEQALTVHEALAASTNGLGTVALGHPADLALLDADPLPDGSPAEQAKALRAMRVTATWVGGRQAHYAL